MPSRACLLLSAFLWTFTTQLNAQAAENLSAGPPKSAAPAHASVVKQPDGKLTVMIRYPWEVHLRPSIEVRLVSDTTKPQTAEPPLKFLKTRMKAGLPDQIYYSLDRFLGVSIDKTIQVDGIDFEVVGRRNFLEKPTVCVISRPRDYADPSTIAEAAFPFLQCWQIDKGLLSLELPKDAFAQSGTLQIWFLRDDTVLWKESVAWPGYPQE
jgi:hypothetical protein